MIFMGLDTETANGLDEGRDLTQSLVYDLGYKIFNEDGATLVRRSFVIWDIFCAEPQMMKESYFAEKIPQYWEDIKNGSRKLVQYSTAMRQLREDVKKYDVNVAFAHNSHFDITALNNTSRWLSKSRFRYALPYGLPMVDTLALAREKFGADEDYIAFCEENGYMTKHRKPQPRFTAEVLYKYFSGNNDFVESHTGLEDVEIETEIFKNVFDFN